MTTRICGGKLFKGPRPVDGSPAAEEEQVQECIHMEQQKKTRTRMYSYGTAKEEEQEQECIHTEEQTMNKNKNVFTRKSRR